MNTGQAAAVPGRRSRDASNRGNADGPYLLPPAAASGTRKNALDLAAIHSRRLVNAMVRSSAVRNMIGRRLRGQSSIAGWPAAQASITPANGSDHATLRHSILTFPPSEGFVTHLLPGSPAAFARSLSPENRP
jgi:hypothetical protein